MVSTMSMPAQWIYMLQLLLVGVQTERIVPDRPNKFGYYSERIFGYPGFLSDSDPDIFFPGYRNGFGKEISGRFRVIREINRNYPDNYPIAIRLTPA